MKKIIILFMAVIFSVGTVLAENYDANFKKVFYDGFEEGMFYSLEQNLLMSGVAQPKVTRYIKAMKARVNRAELENQTWACVSKYSMDQLALNQKKIADECFDKWAENYYIKNKDLIRLLK